MKFSKLYSHFSLSVTRKPLCGWNNHATTEVTIKLLAKICTHHRIVIHHTCCEGSCIHWASRVYLHWTQSGWQWKCSLYLLVVHEMCAPDDHYPTCPHQHRPHMSPCSRCGIAVCGREPPMLSVLRWETAIGEVLVCGREPHNVNYSRQKRWNSHLTLATKFVKSVFAFYTTRRDDKVYCNWSKKIFGWSNTG